MYIHKLIKWYNRWAYISRANSLNRCTMTCFSLALFFFHSVFSFMFLARFFVFACLRCRHHHRRRHHFISMLVLLFFFCCRCNLLVIAISYSSPENPLIWVLFMHMVSCYLCMGKKITWIYKNQFHHKLITSIWLSLLL